MTAKKTGHDRPRSRPRAGRPQAAAAEVRASRRRAGRRAGPLRRRRRRRRSSRRRSSAPAWRRASRSTRSPGFINETALFRNQWQFRPEGGESDDEFKARIRPTLRAELDGAKSEGWLVPAVAWGYFPVNAAGDDLVVWTDDDRTTERCRFHFPRQQKAPFLCIADFFRSVDSGDADYAGFHVVTVGLRGDGEGARAVRGEQVPGLPALPRPLGRDDRGARRAVAQAHPRGVGLRRPRTVRASPDCSGRSTAARATRGAIPACPDLDDQAKLVELLEVDRIGVVAHRGVPARARAVDQRHHRAAPRGEVLRRLTAARAATS